MVQSGEAIAETIHGKVRGVADRGVYVFKGIPYSGPTGGANRFMPPRNPQPWPGVRDCLDWGPMCPQVSGGGALATSMGRDFGLLFGVGAFSVTASEDCLVLNVFTQGLADGKKRPVMVWLHGGGFNIGTGSGPRTDGTNLARNHDVVSVSLNHRLGVLGYCHLGDLQEGFARSGAVGQLDLIAALEWVRDNIAAFGGDPGNVLIHGESGGGAKVHTLMGMPAAKGLFHRAICQSGIVGTKKGEAKAGIGLPDRVDATTAALALLKNLELGSQDVKALQHVPIERLLAVAAPSVSENPFAPVLGTTDIPEHPNTAIAKGSARIPFMVGYTRHEANFMLAAGGIERGTITDEQLPAHFARIAGAKGRELLDGYRAIHPDYSPGDILVRAMTDGFATIGSIAAAEAHVKGGGAPTYMYVFGWESPALPKLQSCHGMDGGFYFENTEALGMTQGNPDARELAAKASAAWTGFARTGDPANARLGSWPAYRPDSRTTMILDSRCRVVNDPSAEDRLLWERIGAS